MRPQSALSPNRTMDSKPPRTNWLGKWVLPDLALLIFCTLLLAMIWGTALVQIETDYQDTMANIQHDGDKFSRSFEEHVRSILKTGDQYLAMLKGEYEASREVTPAIERLLAKIGQDPILMQTGLANASGEMIASPNVFPPGVILADVPHFVAHAATDSGKTYIGRPFVGRISGKTSIHMTKRLNNADGSFGGVAIIAIDADYFSKFFRDLNLAKGYVIRVIGHDKIVRASSQIDEIGWNMTNARIFDKAANQSTGFYQAYGRVFGQPLLMTYRAMPDYPFILQVGVSEVALAGMQQRRYVYLGAASGASLLTVLFTGGLLLRSRRQRQVEARLRQSEERFKVVVTNAPGIIYSVDGQGVFTLSEGLGLAKLGLQPGQVVGQSAREVYCEYPIIVDGMNRALAGEEVTSEFAVVGLQIESHMVPVFDEEQQVKAVIGVAIDVTELKQAQQVLQQTVDTLTATNEELTASNEEIMALYSQVADQARDLRISDEKFQFAIEASQNAIWDLNLETGRYNHFPALSRNLNLAEATSWEEFKERMHPDDLPRRMQALDDYLAGKTSSLEVDYRVQDRDGCWQWILVRGKAVYNDEGKAVRLVGAVANITDLKMREENERYNATHDELTSLLNRRGFGEAVVNSGLQPVATVMLLDIDDFKLINDVYGHVAGDALLQAFASELTRIFGDQALIARQGGDEFLLFFSGSDRHELLLKECEELGNRYIITDFGSFPVHFSVGLAMFPCHGETVEELYRKADVALNQAKKLGKQRFVLYEETMQAKANRRLRIKEGLNRAIEKGELFLVYQPIYNIQGQQERLSSFEALLRWQSADLGFVSPAEFIPVAEETELIIPIGQWVLEKACQFACAAKESYGDYITISVNISVRQLLMANFVSSVLQVMTRAGLPPSHLILEVTESLLMTNIDTCIERLVQLRQAGIALALDDFGTGYSSLTYLRTLPIAIIKMDKAFVDDIANPHSSAAAIFANLIEVGHSLGHRIVAEGVETPNQLVILRSLDCDYCQGYLLNKPLEEQLATEVIRQARLMPEDK